VVHLLMSAPEPQQRLNGFLARLRNGVDQAAAFEQAFGQSPAAALAAASQNVAANQFPEISSLLPAGAAPAPGQAREIAELEAVITRADALLAKGRLTEASESLLDAARRWPSDPSPIAGLGYLAILPRQSVFWETYGRALLAAGDRPAAREAALSATVSSLTPEQAQMAQGLLRDIENQPPARAPAKPAVTTPQGWQPRQGDATLSGRLVYVDCETSLLKFHIETKPAAGRTPAQKTILASDKPNQIMLRGGGPEKKEFVCAAQPARPLVEAGYIAKPAQPPIAGELVWLEFK
jgi:tetratricopeptide (TPR) repeat protein